ncbi:MAG TPA: glycosyltransferase family 39 protein [Steroidobacteraceae bacterium]|nr:glycosyltransferase family 39 protein [Steroidobacteraceae bacterium]
MASSPTQAAAAPAALLLLVLALAPLWLIGMFDRGLWTPDEPREADIAWRMSTQPDRALPQLAGTPFLEKPPLSYWMAAGAISAFGDSPAAARAPNLLYAVIAALAVGALAFAMELPALPALIAALVAASALTAYRVAIWLAPDASLLAGCALALLGAWLGLRAPAGARKAGGYALLHIGAAAGFMAKSAPGWLVPGLALLTLIVWERRWQELRRWELYAGLALQALIIGPWIVAVARSAHGADALRTLFWNNLVGRFTQLSSPATLDYTTGHHNRPGKYLFELPLYLLPWTLVVAAALGRAWTRMREPGARGTAWRFALSSCVPFLVLLSFAATARDIYAAPALLGFGLLAGLWAEDARRLPRRGDRLAALATAALVGVMALAFALALAVLAAAGAGAGAPVLYTLAVPGVIVAAAVGLGFAVRAARGGDFPRSLAWSYAAYALALCLAARLILPVVDRWQDLPALAARIHSDTAQRPLALLDPDETTIAMLDHGLATRFTVLASGTTGARGALDGWFAAHGKAARVLVLLPGHASGALTELLARLHPLPAPGDGVAGTLTAAGAAALVARYELPQGRRYALLAPPPAR